MLFDLDGVLTKTAAVTPGQTSYTLREGDGLEIVHRGNPMKLRASEPVIATD